MIGAILIDFDDNVATVTEPAAAGADVVCRFGSDCVVVAALSNIPPFHKIAARQIPRGEPVCKYGEIIGIAKTDIPAGAHVHTHNVADSLEEVSLKEVALP